MGEGIISTLLVDLLAKVQDLPRIFITRSLISFSPELVHVSISLGLHLGQLFLQGFPLNSGLVQGDRSLLFLIFGVSRMLLF